MDAQLEPFHAIAISRLAHELKAQGRSIIHMEFGQPSTGAPAAAIAVAHQVLDSDGMGYWESTPLKARLARHYHDAYGVEVAPDRFILTCGASPAWCWPCPPASRRGTGWPWLGQAMWPIAIR